MMDAIFYDRKGSKCVKIEDGKTLFDEPIVITSPDGRYCAAVGYWYINDEDSENDGDEIENSAETIVFENEQILYRAKSIEDAEDYTIRDDGKLCVLEENAVSVWSASEKPIRKTFPFSLLDGWINPDFACASGDGEDGNLRLSVLAFETGKMWTKRLSADICTVEAVLMIKNNSDYAQSYFVALVEDYEDGTTLIKYGIDGKKQDLSQNDIIEINSLLAAHKPAQEEATEEEPETEPIVQIEPSPAPSAQKVQKKGFLARLFGK